jgi:hypothetical protein
VARRHQVASSDQPSEVARSTGGTRPAADPWVESGATFRTNQPAELPAPTAVLAPYPADKHSTPRQLWQSALTDN